MSNEPIIDRDYINRFIREAKARQARETSDALRAAWNAVRWRGLSAMVAACLGIFGGHGGTGPDGGAGTTLNS
jgi:hypothetical protein